MNQESFLKKKKKISPFHFYWLERYIHYCEHEKGLSEQTLQSYQRELREFFCWKEQESGEKTTIDIKTIENYRETQVSKRHLSLRSQAHIMSVVRNFFFFVQKRYGTHGTFEQSIDIEKNLAKRITLPMCETSLPQVLSEQEVMMLINFLKQRRKNAKSNAHRQTKWKTTYQIAFRDEILVLTLYILGLRISEALDLSIDSFQKKISFLRIKGKGEKIRFTPLPENLLASIGDYIKVMEVHPAEKSPLFCNRYGKKLSRISCWKMIKKAALEAGISKKISPHTLRHSCATHLLRGGAGIRMVQEFLGHSNIETTEIYTHVASRDLELAIKKHHPLYH